MTLTATVTNDKNSAGVSWSITSGGGTLSNQTTTSATYNAPAATSSQQTITITATSVAKTTQTGTITITVPAAPAVTTTSANLTGAVGNTFSVKLAASGGIPPFTWTLASGTLPACLTLKSDGTLTTANGLAPNASCAGSYTGLTFKATDSGTPTPLNVTSAALTVTITAPSLSFSPTLPGGNVGVAYAGGVGATGFLGASTYTIASGALPADLSLNASTGAITGTPKASDVGTFTFTVNVVDAYQDTATSGSLSITIAAAPAITFTGSVPTTGTYGVAFTGSAAATGGAGALAYSISAGAMPPDLSLNSSTGAITGTPNKAADVGSFSFTVQAADNYGDSNTQSYALTVTYPAMSVTTSTLPTGYVSGLYTQTTLAATGGTGVATNYSWQLSGGTSLPGGLSLSSAGVISGTLLSTDTTGTVNFTVQVTDTVAGISGTANLSIVVDAGVSITTSTTLPTGYVGSNYSQQLAATGGTGTGYTWSVSSGSNLPGGLTLSAGGLLSGAPTATGSPSFSLTVTDSVGNTASATFSMTISPGVSVTAPALANAYPGTAYTSSAFTASGGSGTGYTWSWAAASGSTLPNGLSIIPSTGVISGMPANTGASSVTSSVVVTATDSVGNKGSATVTITIEATLSITTPTTLPAGTISVAYSQPLAASGGSGTGYSWSTDAAGTSSLASVGLALGSNGTVSGSSPTLGTATFTATVTDSEGHTASTAFTVTINNALKINQNTLPAGDAGSSYSQTLTASGGSGAGYTYSTNAAGATSLTAVNLSLSSAGAITGTPSQGTATFTVTVKDSLGATATQAFTITIYGALSLPTPNPSTLPSGYTNISYTGSVSGSGGSGNLSIAVTTALSPANGTLATSVSGATVNVAGTPATATTESFGVTLTDTTTSTTISQTYTITINTPTPVGLPAPNPSSLPAATVNQIYTGAIDATGGVPPYTWSINSTPVTSGGISIGNGLNASSTGGNTLSISGTPTATGTVNLTSVKVVDAASTTATQSYTITVNSAGQNVSGQIYLSNNCGGTSPDMSIFTVTITNVGGTAFTQTQITGSGGNYTFSGVPNGTYTITPTLTTSGPSVVFYPATQQNVSVNNAGVSGENFNVSLGYTVTGTVGYSGSSTGRVYVNLVNNNCGGSGGNGTSITAPGSFTIHGVAPGSYTLQAWMDLSSLNEEAQNEADPAGSTSGLTVATANLTGQTVTLADPTLSLPTTNPKIKSIAPIDGGVVISFGGGSVTDNNGLEMFTSYTVQWSTSTSGFGTSSQATFKATGRNSNVWIVHNLNANMSGSFTNGTAYYFKIWGSNPKGPGPSETSPAAYTPNPPAPGTGLNQVTGTITIPSTVTVSSGAQLYAGLYDQSTNTAYAAVVASPSNLTGNNFTVYVPNGTSYILFGILDQNKDGLIDAEDVTNVNQGNGTPVSISGATSGLSAKLPSTNTIPVVGTEYQSVTSSGGASTSYNLNFNIREGNKLPVAVTLTAGPNVISPVDIGNLCQGCGSIQFQISYGINNDIPTVGDTYTFNVTYSDGSSDTQTAAVTGWNGGSTLVGAANLVTGMSPGGGVTSSSDTPNFSWTDPSVDSTDSFGFFLFNGNYSSEIWQIPGNNSNSNGFSSSITSITWGVDPTGGGSVPNPSSLTSLQTYNWLIVVQDSGGNQAQTWNYFVAP